MSGRVIIWTAVGVIAAVAITLVVLIEFVEFVSTQNEAPRWRDRLPVVELEFGVTSAN